MIELFFEVGPGKPNSCSHPGIHISYSFIVVSYTFWLFVYLYIFVEAFPAQAYDVQAVPSIDREENDDGRREENAYWASSEEERD